MVLLIMYKVYLIHTSILRSLGAIYFSQLIVPSRFDFAASESIKLLKSISNVPQCWDNFYAITVCPESLKLGSKYSPQMEKLWSG